MNEETLGNIDSSSEHNSSKAKKKAAKTSRKSSDEKVKKSKKPSKKKDGKKKYKKKSEDGSDFGGGSSHLSLSVGSEFDFSSNDESSILDRHSEGGSPDQERKSQRPRRGRKSADQPRGKSKSVGILEQKQQERYLLGRDTSKSSLEAGISEHGSTEPDQIPQRPTRGKRSSDEPRYKSKSVGGLEKKKQGRYRRKNALKPPSSSAAVENENDDDSSVDISDWSSESETKKPARPKRKHALGNPKVKSKSTGPLDRKVQGAFLKILGQETSSGDDSSSGRESNRRATRPPRVRQTAAQPRVKSSSVGALDRKKQEMFLKPRKLSTGALQAKAHVERSVQESSLHMAQPSIRLALPRVKSAGALNAKPRRASLSPTRLANDPIRKWNDEPFEISLDVSPAQAMLSSGRRMSAVSQDSSDDSDDFGGPILPLPQSMRSNRAWAESKQADQLPSMDKALSARNLERNNSNEGTWHEALRDDKGQEQARKQDRKERKKQGRPTPKKMASLPQVALPLGQFTPSRQKDSKNMSQNLKALLAPGAIQDQKDKRRRGKRTSDMSKNEQEK